MVFPLRTRSPSMPNRRGRRSLPKLPQHQRPRLGVRGRILQVHIGLGRETARPPGAPGANRNRTQLFLRRLPPETLSQSLCQVKTRTSFIGNLKLTLRRTNRQWRYLSEYFMIIARRRFNMLPVGSRGNFGRTWRLLSTLQKTRGICWRHSMSIRIMRVTCF